MAEFYNAETLLEFVKQNTPHIDDETTMECVERAIKEAPTADVVKVRHGEWSLKRIGVGSYWECSECEFRLCTMPRTRYCPHCGAKMNGGNAE